MFKCLKEELANEDHHCWLGDRKSIWPVKILHQQSTKVSGLLWQALWGRPNLEWFRGSKPVEQKLKVVIHH